MSINAKRNTFSDKSTPSDQSDKQSVSFQNNPRTVFPKEKNNSSSTSCKVTPEISQAVKMPINTKRNTFKDKSTSTDQSDKQSVSFQIDPRTVFPKEKNNSSSKKTFNDKYARSDQSDKQSVSFQNNPRTVFPKEKNNSSSTSCKVTPEISQSLKRSINTKGTDFNDKSAPLDQSHEIVPLLVKESPFPLYTYVRQPYKPKGTIILTPGAKPQSNISPKKRGFPTSSYSDMALPHPKVSKISQDSGNDSTASLTAVITKGSEISSNIENLPNSKSMTKDTTTIANDTSKKSNPSLIFSNLVNGAKYSTKITKNKICNPIERNKKVLKVTQLNKHSSTVNVQSCDDPPNKSSSTNMDIDPQQSKQSLNTSSFTVKEEICNDPPNMSSTTNMDIDPLNISSSTNMDIDLEPNKYSAPLHEMPDEQLLNTTSVTVKDEICDIPANISSSTNMDIEHQHNQPSTPLYDTPYEVQSTIGLSVVKQENTDNSSLYSVPEQGNQPTEKSCSNSNMKKDNIMVTNTQTGVSTLVPLTYSCKSNELETIIDKATISKENIELEEDSCESSDESDTFSESDVIVSDGRASVATNSKSRVFFESETNKTASAKHNTNNLESNETNINTNNCIDSNSALFNNASVFVTPSTDKDYISRYICPIEEILARKFDACENKSPCLQDRHNYVPAAKVVITDSGKMKHCESIAHLVIMNIEVVSVIRDMKHYIYLGNIYETICHNVSSVNAKKIEEKAIKALDLTDCEKLYFYERLKCSCMSVCGSMIMLDDLIELFSQCETLSQLQTRVFNRHNYVNKICCDCHSTMKESCTLTLYADITYTMRPNKDMSGCLCNSLNTLKHHSLRYEVGYVHLFGHKLAGRFLAYRSSKNNEMYFCVTELIGEGYLPAELYRSSMDKIRGATVELPKVIANYLLQSNYDCTLITGDWLDFTSLRMIYCLTTSYQINAKGDVKRQIDEFRCSIISGDVHLIVQAVLDSNTPVL